MIHSVLQELENDDAFWMAADWIKQVSAFSSVPHIHIRTMSHVVLPTTSGQKQAKKMFRTWTRSLPLDARLKVISITTPHTENEDSDSEDSDSAWPYSTDQFFYDWFAQEDRLEVKGEWAADALWSFAEVAHSTASVIDERFKVDGYW